MLDDDPLAPIYLFGYRFYLSIYLFICLFMNLCLHKGIYTFICKYLCIRVYIYAYTYIRCSTNTRHVHMDDASHGRASVGSQGFPGPRAGSRWAARLGEGRMHLECGSPELALYCRGSYKDLLKEPWKDPLKVLQGLSTSYRIGQISVGAKLKSPGSDRFSEQARSHLPSWCRRAPFPWRTTRGRPLRSSCGR